MRLTLAALLAAALAACSPAPAPSATDDYETGSAPAPANADWGPYENSWDSAAFTTFQHSLNVAEPGPHEVTIWAQTDSPGGETVAMYQLDADGRRMGGRVFVIATTRGESRSEILEFPADGRSMPVEVVVENASGNRYAGRYTITIAP